MKFVIYFQEWGTGEELAIDGELEGGIEIGTEGWMRE